MSATRVTITSLSVGCWAASQYIHSTALSYHSRMLGSSQQSSLPSAVHQKKTTDSGFRNTSSFQETSHGPAFRNRVLCTELYFPFFTIPTLSLRLKFGPVKFAPNNPSWQLEFTDSTRPKACDSSPLMRRSATSFLRNFTIACFFRRSRSSRVRVHLMACLLHQIKQ